MLDVAATLGQAYTVVGQGLVDAALSLRPEERRELFEEAAAIRGYFVQRDDALKRLTKTEENAARVGDLLAELEPQVRRMERSALPVCMASRSKDGHASPESLKCTAIARSTSAWMVPLRRWESWDSAHQRPSPTLGARDQDPGRPAVPCDHHVLVPVLEVVQQLAQLRPSLREGDHLRHGRSVQNSDHRCPDTPERAGRHTSQAVRAPINQDHILDKFGREWPGRSRIRMSAR